MEPPNVMGTIHLSFGCGGMIQLTRRIPHLVTAYTLSIY